MIQQGTDAPRWLFPGRIPGQPIDNLSLTNRLNRHIVGLPRLGKFRSCTTFTVCLVTRLIPGRRLALNNVYDEAP